MGFNDRKGENYPNSGCEFFPFLEHFLIIYGFLEVFHFDRRKIRVLSMQTK
jgi:hypothetical protein